MQRIVTIFYDRIKKKKTVKVPTLRDNNKFNYTV